MVPYGKAITMALKSRCLPVQCWQTVLLDVLHSIRSLQCTATNATPHERHLNYSRCSSTGASVPSWLCPPGAVLLKRNVRMKKQIPLWKRWNSCKQILIMLTICYQNEEQTTVSTRHLSPVATPIVKEAHDIAVNIEEAVLDSPGESPDSSFGAEDSTPQDFQTPPGHIESNAKTPVLRCSERARYPPDRLDL